ncbi:uncharacterized protein LOC125048357 [Penaeus chinensis]|uniref:uncharacterized protein LOC125048357 n=1 Tax=Penaeus chinensis TaxID=139456 RepID=UPI001FB5F528|nr:uncharacterized protein LOC125048357 [Penaeus chinensis]
MWCKAGEEGVGEGDADEGGGADEEEYRSVRAENETGEDDADVVVMGCLTEELRRSSPWDIMYDVVICTNDRETCEEKPEQWTQALERRGMKVSRTKTECLNAGNGTQRVGSISLGGERVQRVAEFKYLGSIVQEDGGSEAEVSKRIEAG